MLGLKAAEEGKSLDLLVSDPALVPRAAVMAVEAHLGYLCLSQPYGEGFLPGIQPKPGFCQVIVDLCLPPCAHKWATFPGSPY